GAPGRVVARVEAVAVVGGEVDAADEGDAVVDDDELLVVAVERPLAVVERTADPRPALERLAQLAGLGAGRMEERERRARPEAHPPRQPRRALGEDRPHLVARRRPEAGGRRPVP